MRRTPLVIAAVALLAAGTALEASRSDGPGRRPERTTRAVSPGPEPWSRSFSVVAGGGLRTPAKGVVAGDARFGHVWSGARDGAGRVVVDTSSGTWVVGFDGRLARVRGLTPVPAGSRFEVSRRRSLAALPDGSVAITDALAHRVATLAPGSDRVTGLATATPTPEALGLDRDGTLVGVAAGRVLRLRHSAMVAGTRLYEDDGIRRGSGIGPTRGGLLAASVFPNDGPDAESPADETGVQLVAGGEATAAPELPADPGVRGLAVLPDGRALLATSTYVGGALDGRPLALAAGPTVDRSSFGYGVGEEYYGWLTRRRTLLRTTDGRLRPARWAGPPAEAVSPDGAADLLVASSGRLWTTRRGLSAPKLDELWDGRIGVRVGAASRVTVTVRGPDGALRTGTRPRRIPAGATTLKLLRGIGTGLARVTVTAARAGRTSATSAWAFAAAPRFTPQAADRVLSVIAKRLNVGFEAAISHGVDRCAVQMAGTVVCRWTTLTAQTTATERSVRLARSPSGYAVNAGPPRPSPKRGRNTHLLGAPFDASA